MNKICLNAAALLLLFSINLDLAKAATVTLQVFENEVVEGNQVRLDVLISGAVGISGIQMDIGFDPAVVQFSSVSQGSFLSNGGGQSILLGTEQVTQPGLLRFLSAVRVGGGVNGSGTVFSVYFTAIKQGNSNFFVSDVKISGHQGVPLSNISTVPSNAVILDNPNSVSAGSGSSGGGGSAPLVSGSAISSQPSVGNYNTCYFIWECDEWGICQNESRKRSCRLAEVPAYLQKEKCHSMNSSPAMEADCSAAGQLTGPGEAISQEISQLKSRIPANLSTFLVALTGTFLIVVFSLRLIIPGPAKKIMPVPENSMIAVSDYIEKMRKLGRTEKEIYESLVKSGWKPDLALKLLKEWSK